MLKHKIRNTIIDIIQVNILSQIDPKGDIFLLLNSLYGHMSRLTHLQLVTRVGTGMDYCHTLVDARQTYLE